MDLAELDLVIPEILLLTMASLILVIGAYTSDRAKNLVYQLSQGTLLGTILFVMATFPEARTVGLNGMFVTDAMAAVLKVVALITVMFTFVDSRAYLEDRKIASNEFFVLGLFATLGMMIMISAQNMLTIYLGLELLSLSLYAMVAMYRDSHKASEAAMKYFVLGALASGMLLYGMSILYGASNTLDLTALAQAISTGDQEQKILVFGLVFIMVGLAFKFGAVPFHMWVPDVYEGAPTPVATFLSSAPKLAAFAMMMRLLVEGMPALHVEWQQMLVILAVLSIILGNLIAIAQTNIKRMFAYSTISHVGFLMLGVLTATDTGYAASMFYAIVYTLMSLGGFGIILLLSRAGFEADKIEDYKGLNTRSPWYAFIMMILLLSMAGMPPLLGFWAKLEVLIEVIKADLLWLAIVAVIFSVIGAFYYLRVIWMMYFEKPEDESEIAVGTDMQVAISLNGLAILFLGIFPQSLMVICLNSI